MIFSKHPKAWCSKCDCIIWWIVSQLLKFKILYQYGRREERDESNFLNYIPVAQPFFRLSESAGTLKLSFLFTVMLGTPVCASIMEKQLTLTMRIELFMQYSQANRYMSFH